jgi:hypothetical protein
VKRLAFGVCAMVLVPLSPLQAQNPAIDDLKGKIFDAQMAQKMYADGLKHCSELNGKTFYQRLHNRILNLEEYLQSLDNLVKAEVFNPEKRRPWSAADAKERQDAVKKEAQEDKARCDLVQSLPELQKQLQELEKNAATSEKKN